jgi:hypothetical protein
MPSNCECVACKMFYQQCGAWGVSPGLLLTFFIFTNFCVSGSHFYNNSLSGSIPPELGGTTTGKPLGSLIHLLLDSNAFSGTIPDSLGNITTLQILNLMNNELTGQIPQSLNNITSPTGTLQQLQLGYNQLNGTIPNLSALHDLTLM